MGNGGDVVGFATWAPFTLKAGRSLRCRGRAEVLRNGRGRVMAVANPISPSDNGVMLADREADKDEAFKVWAQCVRECPERSVVPVRDDADGLESTKYVVLRERGRTLAAGRMMREGQNVLFSKVAVIPSERGKGYGRRLVQAMLGMCVGIEGVVFVKAHRWELGFYSLLGFNCQGPEESGNGTSPAKKQIGNQAISSMQFTDVKDLLSGQLQGIPTRTMVYHFSGVDGAVEHHVVLKTRDIERSLGFYGAIGFTCTEKYLVNGMRACKLEGFDTSLELEEVEAPDRHSACSAGHDEMSGSRMARLTLDVTKICTDLPGYVNHLQRRHGGGLRLAAYPAEVVRGRAVQCTATVVDPDGHQLEFVRREGSLPHEMVGDFSW